MILVTGATGTVGSEVVRQLVAQGRQVRVLVRNPDAAAAALPAGVQIARGDLARPDSIEAALTGIERMYLLAPLSVALPQWEAGAIEAARRAGVQHVVKHSNLGAAEEPGTTMQRWHRASEKLLESSGVAWTFVRPTGFMSTALGWAATIKSQGAVYAPGGDGKLSVVDPRDIAAVAVAALTEPGHEGRSYEVTGPQALSAAEQVETIAAAIGKPIKFIDIPDATAREHMLANDMPEVIVNALLEFVTIVRAGRAATVTDAVPTVTGRPARTFRTWVDENTAAFKC